MKRAIKTILGEIIRVGEGYDVLRLHVQVNPLHEMIFVRERKVKGNWVVCSKK